MRLFVAVEISPEIRDRLTALISDLRPKLANAAWARPEGLHITLKFLGNVLDENISAIEAALRSVKAIAFSLSIANVGVFPSPRSPRVLWAGIDSGPELSVLAAKIEDALNPLDFAREKRTFSPHVTLARFKSTGNKLELAKLLAAHASGGAGGDVSGFGTMAATHFHLYESKLSPHGARYNKLASFILE